MEEEEDYLVPGRECGACTACCTDLAITADGMNKLPGVACVHCVAGSGCAIYAARPNVCRSYHCLWRSLPDLDEGWRPDRSGILMLLGEAPPQFAGDFAVDLILLGASEALESDSFAGLVGGFIESGTATHLNVPKGLGYLAYNALLNELLGPAIAARDLSRVKSLIRRAYEDMRAMPPEPVILEDIDSSRSTRD